MTNLASYFIVGLAFLLATDYFNAVVESDTPPSGVVSADPASMVSDQVDRSHKGDRLDRPAQAVLVVRDIEPVEARRVRVQVFHRPKPLSLPVGCEALASALAGSSLSDLAGRCLTDNASERKLAAVDRMPV
jgi:hypothetical protein